MITYSAQIKSSLSPHGRLKRLNTAMDPGTHAPALAYASRAWVAPLTLAGQTLATLTRRMSGAAGRRHAQYADVDLWDFSDDRGLGFGIACADVQSADEAPPSLKVVLRCTRAGYNRDPRRELEGDRRRVVPPKALAPIWLRSRELVFTLGLSAGFTVLITRFGCVWILNVISVAVAVSVWMSARRYSYSGSAVSRTGAQPETQPFTGGTGAEQPSGLVQRGFPAVNFWHSLEPAQRQAFTSVARERMFARGAMLMHEGELANHVMVILRGWTRVSVYEYGRERVIAELGPGQLVGERGALQVNVRSATVVALEKVHALVMSTEDFAAFISAHPRVLDLVESQIYDRLTEGPAVNGRAGWPDAFLPGPVSHPLPEGPRQYPLAGENCTVLLTDVVGFGEYHRSDRDRRIIRQTHLDMMRMALGTLWGTCISEDQGDGLLIVVPPAIPTAKVMEHLHRVLPGELKMHNRTYGEPVRIRLRVAVNVGPVMGDLLGMSGEAIIRATRLLDAPNFKSAMASTAARLGIVVSEFVYETAIRHAEGWTDPEKYESVQVTVKETRTRAWMQLVDPAPRPNPLLMS